MEALKTVGELPLLAIYAVVVSLPGIAIAYVGWKQSRRWRSFSVQTFFRASLIAVTVTPSIYGHAGILPAIFLAFVLTGKEKLIGIDPILLVWIVAVPVIYVLGVCPRIPFRSAEFS